MMDQEMGGAGEQADPMAMLAFLQRLVTTMSSGGDVEALMADAPPGFQELFADAERRVQAGEVPDLSQLMGIFGAQTAYGGDAGIADDAEFGDDAALAADGTTGEDADDDVGDVVGDDGTAGPAGAR